MTKDAASGVYEARYGWDGKTLGVVAGAAVLTMLLLVSDAPPVLRAICVVLFGGGGLFMAFVALSRRPAFRVDGKGVLLGGSPARYRATTVHVPWQDITAIVLWQQKMPGGSLPWVGVASGRAPSRRPPPGRGKSHGPHCGPSCRTFRPTWC